MEPERLCRNGLNLNLNPFIQVKSNAVYELTSNEQVFTIYCPNMKSVRLEGIQTKDTYAHVRGNIDVDWENFGTWSIFKSSRTHKWTFVSFS